ncbi:MAG TPA: rhomboid family intramembrane serine protease [Chitinophagales bacterium]|nr:rhomboid family intramembrane serine protease [Chitinophagales bacterium]
MNITILIVAVTCIISFLAFNNLQLVENLVFYPYRIWRNKEYHRFVSCAFIHGDGMHLLFNMFALYSFGAYVENGFEQIYEMNGHVLYVIMYFGAVITADMWNLFKQKDNPNYRSLGASGGVSAVVFAFILMNPFGKLYLFFIPIGIPAFIFGPLYLAYCIYMDKRGGDNIGHMAHFTGSLFGFVFPIIFEPRLFLRFLNLLTNGAIG